MIDNDNLVLPLFIWGRGQRKRRDRGPSSSLCSLRGQRKRRDRGFAIWYVGMKYRKWSCYAGLLFLWGEEIEGKRICLWCESIYLRYMEESIPLRTATISRSISKGGRNYVEKYPSLVDFALLRRLIPYWAQLDRTDLHKGGFPKQTKSYKIELIYGCLGLRTNLLLLIYFKRYIAYLYSWKESIAKDSELRGLSRLRANLKYGISALISRFAEHKRKFRFWGFDLGWKGRQVPKFQIGQMESIGQTYRAVFTM